MGALLSSVFTHCQAAFIYWKGFDATTSQCTTNLCLICTCRRACPNPLVDLPRHGSFSVQIFTSFGVQVLCSDFAAVLDTCVPFPASYKNLKFSVRLLCPRAAPRLHPTWRPTQLPAPHQAYNAMPPPSLQSTGLLSLQSLQFEYNPLKGIQPWGYNTTPWRPWGLQWNTVALLFCSRSKCILYARTFLPMQHEAYGSPNQPWIRLRSYTLQEATTFV